MLFVSLRAIDAANLSFDYDTSAELAHRVIEAAGHTADDLDAVWQRFGGEMAVLLQEVFLRSPQIAVLVENGIVARKVRD